MRSSLQVLVEIMQDMQGDIKSLLVSNATLVQKVDGLEKKAEDLESELASLKKARAKDPARPRSFARDAAAGGSGALLIAALQALQAFLSQPPAVKAPPAPAAIVQPK